MPVDFAASGLSAMSIAAHKFGGPTGVGALLLPLLWRAVVRIGPFRAGPLEGVVRLLTAPFDRAR